MKKNKIIKGLGITLGVIAFIGIAGSIAMGGYVSDRILHQNEGKDTHDNSIKQLEVWGYDTEKFENTYEGIEVSATAEDGNTVPGTYYDNGSDKCVILVHGAGGDRVCMYPLAELYLEDGFDVISIDQRGCGENADDRVTFGINESLDVKAMVKFAREEIKAGKVIVHGQSMGGQTVAIYASNVTPGTAEAADAVICDSPVPGMELVLKEMFGDGDTDSFMAKYLTGTSKAFMKVANGIDYDDGDTINVVRNDNIPTMIIVSDRDEVCLPDQVEEIYDNIACENKAIYHADSAHIEGVIDDPDAYMNSVESFLNGAGI
ncbi:MAG: alpha/beta fold hydrolase [Clostridiales bacterium]|nr:alpha/beta fold hydrolase [Clostridiales bacterium]MBQ1293438.1 alpha/beta fold hydrolase [Clostridiales bacterium]